MIPCRGAFVSYLMIILIIKLTVTYVKFYSHHLTIYYVFLKINIVELIMSKFPFIISRAKVVQQSLSFGQVYYSALQLYLHENLQVGALGWGNQLGHSISVFLAVWHVVEKIRLETIHSLEM